MLSCMVTFLYIFMYISITKKNMAPYFYKIHLVKTFSIMYIIYIRYGTLNTEIVKRLFSYLIFEKYSKYPGITRLTLIRTEVCICDPSCTFLLLSQTNVIKTISLTYE